MVARANGIAGRLQGVESAELPFVGADGLVGLTNLHDDADAGLTAHNPIEVSLYILSIRLSRCKLAFAIARWPRFAGRRGGASLFDRAVPLEFFPNVAPAICPLAGLLDTVRGSFRLVEARPLAAEASSLP